MQGLIEGGDCLFVSAITRFDPEPVSSWSNGRWQVDGIVCGREVAQRAGEPREIRTGVWLWPGLVCRLYRDQAEAYYLNLMSATPRVFVVCSALADGSLSPILATVNFDEALSYDEGEQIIADVPMPAEMYRWLEAFVLKHYVPEEPRKRQRDNWKEGGHHGR